MTEPAEVLAHLREVAETATDLGPGMYHSRFQREITPTTVLKLLAVAAQTIELCDAIEEYFTPAPPSEHFFEDLAVARAALAALPEEGP